MSTPRHEPHGHPRAPHGGLRPLALSFVAVVVGACAPSTQSAPGVGSPAVGLPATPAVAPPPPPPPLTPNDFLASVRAPFDACFAQARRSNPNLPRTNVEITFTRDENGKLLNVDFVYRNRLDDAAKDCMRTAAEAVTFPPALRGTQTATIVFTPP